MRPHRRSRCSTLLPIALALTVLIPLAAAAPLPVIGTTSGRVEDPGYCAGEREQRIPHMKIQLVGGASGFSDSNGDFELPCPGTDPVEIAARLEGRYIRVHNLAGPDASFLGVALPGTLYPIEWNDGNSSDAERCAYLFGTRVHDMVKRFGPDWAAPDVLMLVEVNASFSCGTMWDGSKITLPAAGYGCANLARIGDAVYHTYGHAVTQWIYGGNPPDVAEGNADILACFVDGDPLIGEGFLQDDCTHGLHSVENTLQYPGDYDPQDPYQNGLIIAGFWWDAWRALAVQLGQQDARDVIWSIWLLSRIHYLSQSLPEQVYCAFLEAGIQRNQQDDDPLYDALCVGARNHGFDCPLLNVACPMADGAASHPVLSCFPNPAAGRTMIRFRTLSADGAGEWDLAIFDVSGRPVRRMEGRSPAGGSSAITWDGKDEQGRPVPGGLYLVTLQSGGARASERVVILR